MELDLYSVIMRPRVTSKAYTLNQKLSQLVLEVHPEANKPMVVEALKKLFNVEVESVRIVVAKGKRRRAGRHTVVGKLRKKAIVSLKKGMNIDLVGWSRPVDAQAEQSASDAQQA